ncbi:M3 family metallopeptidase [Rarobacter incanus]|uniref:Peptidyl-dipeptidase Dcp n=1 Tax=Rarobacter incanus TaxID=153494 RepID=A0A542SPP8_9MICO|nr:M3 family metallopeptidase [Rarobacter incanus]TQK76589.1 peptidyl-dipeptidase Dcp [Rarobacter incanus]
MTAYDSTNPLLAPSALPYQIPNFRRITADHYLPALRAALAQQAATVAAIGAETRPPTTANVLDPWERSVAAVNAVTHPLFNQVSADGTAAFQAVNLQASPLLASHHDDIFMNRAFLARLKGLAANQRDLSPEQSHRIAEMIRDFTRAGADLPTPEQAQLRELNTRINELQTAFEQAVLEAGNAAAVTVADRAALAGLPDDAADALATADGYAIDIKLPTAQLILESLDDRDLRERVQKASEGRALRPPHDTRPLVAELAALRARRARLLGFPNHAAYVAQGETAGTTKRIDGLLSELTPRAVANARLEGAALQQRLDAEDPGAQLRSSDWLHTAAKLRADTFGFDMNQVRPYLELETVVRDGVFFAASELFGISFAPRPDIVAYHPDVRVFEVFDQPEPGARNSGIGLYLADWFTRDTKAGGAWMNTLVDQNHLLGQRSVVVNNLNINKPAPGEPALLRWDEVITLFHEFGHALHALFSDVTYPSSSGTNVPRDFVEYPSQVNEMWAWEPRVLANFARHYKTGEPLDPAIVDKILAARQFGEGFATTEYLAAAVLDQAWHRLGPNEVPADPAGVTDFEESALTDAGFDYPLVPPRYRSTYFKHIFAGGYSAAYYAYIFSEVLDADTVAWYAENGGLTRANGERFRREVLAPGGSGNPLSGFESLRGRPARVDALLRRRGLTG